MTYPIEGMKHQPVKPDSPCRSGLYIFYFVKTCRHPRFNSGVFVPKIAQTSLCLQKIVDCRHEFIRAIRQERLSRDIVAPRPVLSLSKEWPPTKG